MSKKDGESNADSGVSRAVVCTDDVCSGRPRVAGTRLTCANVVQLLIELGSKRRFVESYPSISLSVLDECLGYCSAQSCLIDAPENFCIGCAHDTDGDEETPSVFIDNLKGLMSLLETKAGRSANTIFYGTLAEYLDERGQRITYWKLASQLLQRPSGPIA